MTTEPPSDKLFTAEETAILRRKYVEQRLLPPLDWRFKYYPNLKSAALFVAQYWDDEANDAVNVLWIFSVLETPDFDYPFSNSTWTEENLAARSPGESGEAPTLSKIQDEEDDPVNLPNLPTHSQIEWFQGPDFRELAWDHNGMAIPLFAAFCKEGAHQEMNSREAYSCFAIFRKTADGIDIEYAGKMLRPWLEGIRPEYFQRFPEFERNAIDQLLKETAD
jgi:hypothetical protein